MEREFESKGLISEEQFKELLIHLNPNEIREQKNIYLDTVDGYFKRDNSALRLRVINGKYIFSLKRQDVDGCTEWNQPLTKEKMMSITESKSVNLQDFNCPQNDILENLIIIEISTTRYVCDFKGNTIELDQTTFNNTVDYEIEVEAEDLQTADQIMRNLRSEFSLDIKKSYPKIARYYLYN